MRALLGSLRAALTPRAPRGAPARPPSRLDLSGFETVYAVGDAHGCLELALDLEEKILSDAASGGGPSAILYLGDVIDRGPKSAHLLDHLTSRTRGGLPRFCLRGNHEQFLLDFIDDPKASLDWLDFGGRETLNSYGVYETRAGLERMRAAEIRALLAASIPEAHTAFLRALPHYAREGGVLFCHAGVDPTRALDAQTAEDFMWARERFISHAGGFECLIVHGHTPTDRAAVGGGRANVDTGAHETGLLSCAKVTPATGGVSFLTSNS